MAIFRITVKTTRVGNGQRVDKGLYVDLQTYNNVNPIYNNKEQIAQAFLYQRGVDVKKLGVLNSACLDIKRLG